MVPWAATITMQMSIDLGPERMRYFEDIDVGESHRSTEYEITVEEITEIAERFDPQPFHLDPTAARESVFGGLAASGVLTIGVCQRLAVESFHTGVAVAGGAGINDLRFPRPVFGGDVLSAALDVTAKRSLDSYPDMGIVHLHQVLSNQKGEPVLEMTSLPMVRCQKNTEP